MSIQDLGERMTAHELGVIWPAYYRHRERLRERQEQSDTRDRMRTF